MIENDLKMSITTVDPVERLLDSADQGRTIIKNPNVLRHDYIPERILHRDKQQELVTQSLIPLYKKSIPPNLLVYGKPGTGKMIHQGIHGNTKKFNLTISPDLIKNTLKTNEIFADIL